MTPANLMTGFPPAAELQVTLGNWRTAPYNKWAFQHTREIIPSADIPNEPEGCWRLPSAEVDFRSLSISASGQRLSWDAFLEGTDTDGIVIMHRGLVVAEAYANGMTRDTRHIWMSVSKSVLGVMTGILADSGVLDVDWPVSRLIPEVSGTAYAGATLRHLLDMTAGVHFDEDYLATTGAIIQYRKAQNWDPLKPGDKPSDLRSFYQSLTIRDGTHGDRLRYISPNTDLLGWVIERAAGERYADLVSRLLWRPLGASRSAYITVDRLGAPRCAGGVCATVLDLARLGQLIVQDGERDQLQIVPKAWIEDTLSRGDPQAWDHGSFVGYFPGTPMSYRSQWYVPADPSQMMFALGVFGQYLFVDRGNQIVIAKASSQALPMDERRISLTMDGVRAIREHLAGMA